MNLSIGIVGLPNVGKSTLFNALLKKQQALAANYPFATIEPNIGVVPVPDQRLQKLAEITKEEVKMGSLPPIKAATVEFVDIAGLVKGAAEGAGLGNKFLSHIREVSVIAHVVRAFADSNVIREGSNDPQSDYDVIKTELILADLQTLEKSKDKKAKADEVKSMAIEKLLSSLNIGKAAREVSLDDEERESVKDLFLITAKPELIVLNVDENQYSPDSIDKLSKEYGSLLKVEEDQIVVICAKIESDLAELGDEEQKQYLLELGLEFSGLERLIQKAYTLLGLISFLTCGEKEVRAWTIEKEMLAPQAAGAIHTDFEKAFIKAEVVSYDEFVSAGGWKKSRELGKARIEGRDYVMKDGDVVEFKVNA